MGARRALGSQELWQALKHNVITCTLSSTSDTTACTQALATHNTHLSLSNARQAALWQGAVWTEARALGQAGQKVNTEGHDSCASVGPGKQCSARRAAAACRLTLRNLSAGTLPGRSIKKRLASQLWNKDHQASRGAPPPNQTCLLDQITIMGPTGTPAHPSPIPRPTNIRLSGSQTRLTPSAVPPSLQGPRPRKDSPLQDTAEQTTPSP